MTILAILGIYCLISFAFLVVGAMVNDETDSFMLRAGAILWPILVPSLVRRAWRKLTGGT